MHNQALRAAVEDLRGRRVIKRDVEIAKKTGYSKGLVSSYLSGRIEASDKFMERFNEVYKEFLESSKVTTGREILMAAEASAEYKRAARGRSSADTRRPIYTVSGTAGEVVIFQDEPENIEGYIDVPEFGNLTGYIRVFGNSMYPKYCNGDLVGCRELKNKNIIPYGEAYLVITDEHRMIKYIDSYDHDESKLTLRSEHPDYKPFSINRDDIKKLYIIKGKITRNII